MTTVTQHTDLSEPVWGRTADDLRDRLRDENPAADRAYSTWRQHIDGCTQCGDALAPCQVEPQLWSSYRELTS